MLPEPVVLGFDTSAAHCAAAVILGDRVLAARLEPMEKGQAERLMPLLAEVLAEAGLGYGDLDAIGVGTGPGNFTGVRIAVSAARGLALALEVPAIGVTGFEALSHGLPEGVVALLDARRGAVWLSAQGVAPCLCAPGDWPEGLAGRDVVGHGAEALAAVTGGRVLVAQPLAVAVAVAVALVAAGRLGSPQPRPAPMYLRAADAALPADPPPVILP